nr:unnamed protein product [Callosobruchus analis]
MECEKCKEVLPPDTKSPCCCESCNTVLCKKCSQLCPSEIKVMELSQRRMIFLCPNCKISFQLASSNIITEHFQELKTKMLEAIDHKHTNQLKIFQDLLQNQFAQQIQNLTKLTNSLCKKLEANPVVPSGPEQRKRSTTVGPHISDNERSSSTVKEAPLKNNLKESSGTKTQHTKRSVSTVEPKNELINLKHKQEEIMRAVINLTNDTPVQQNQNQHAQEDGFIEVKRKRRRHQQPMIGTGQLDLNSNFQGSAAIKERKIWIFLKKVRDCATMEDITVYLCKNLNQEENQVYVKKVETYYRTKDNNCYLVGVNPSFQSQIYDINFWPKGVVISRFNFFKGEKFLDKSKIKINAMNSDEPNDSVFVQAGPSRFLGALN